MRQPSMIVSHRGQAIGRDYNEINIESEDEKPHAASEFELAQKIGTALVRHYPGRQWGVQVDNFGRMIILTCPSLSLKCGYYLPMDLDSTKTIIKRAVRACGEILERYNISRNRIYDSTELDYLPRDFRDEVISSDAIPDSITKRIRSGD